MILSGFNTNPPSMLEEAKVRIEKLTILKRSTTQIRFFLKKARSIPAKANKEVQEKFIDEVLQPILKEAENNDDIEVYFGDGVHLIYGAELGYSWCMERQEVKYSYGRKIFNVMGAINSTTSETVVSNDSYITSNEIVELFLKLRQINNDKKVYIILDNAKYQKCELASESNKKYDINIIYLPTYSPNLIERLWKFLRKECLCNKYLLNFKLFSESILECLSKTHTEYKERLTSLLSYKFEALGD